LALPRLPGIIQAMNNVLDHQYKEFIGTIKSESQIVVPDSDVSEYAKRALDAGVASTVPYLKYFIFSV
jgi:hypothetical protein